MILLFVAIKKRVEALDKEEKELDLRLKQLQMKGIRIKIIIAFQKLEFSKSDFQINVFIQIVTMIAVANITQMGHILICDVNSQSIKSIH